MRRLLAGLVAAPLLLLAACGEDDPEPSFEPTPSQTASSSAAAEPSESPAPEKETAEEFIRRWQATANEMQVSGDTAEFRALGSRCKPCTQFANRVDAIYDNGGFIKTDGIRIDKIKALGTDDALHTYDFSGVSDATRLKESAGAPIQRLEGGPTEFRITLRPPGAKGWRVVLYTVTSS